MSYSTHGYTTGINRVRTPPTYVSWQHMKQRCLNPNHHAWARYGGRGITICAQWLHSFPQFLADMGERPSGRHSLDRINSDGNYEPSNCRWATSSEQNHNKPPATQAQIAHLNYARAVYGAGVQERAEARRQLAARKEA